MTKNKSTDAAAENVSADSLSFAGLICIEDQQSKSQNIHPPPTNNSANSPKLQQDLDFEFSSTVSGSTGPPVNNSLADHVLLISNGQLVPAQAITSQSQLANSSWRCNNKRANESAKKTNTKVRNKGATVSQWFGQKIIRSFATPCRNCRAIQPSPSMKLRTGRHFGNEN